MRRVSCEETHRGKIRTIFYVASVSSASTVAGDSRTEPLLVSLLANVGFHGRAKLRDEFFEFH